MIYRECSSTTERMFTEIDNDRSEAGKERYVMGGPRDFWKITGLQWPTACLPASTCWLLNRSNKNVNRPAQLEGPVRKDKGCPAVSAAVTAHYVDRVLGERRLGHR